MASEKELQNQLSEAAGKLVSPPASTDELLQLLNQVDSCLVKVEQSPSESTQSALSPLIKALVGDPLLRHPDVDVKVAVAACLSEITRITAPDAPYEDDQMREVFRLIVCSFENLSDNTSQSYAKRMSILYTVAKVRSCVVMLDLECDALILEMFQHFLKAIRDYHPESVFSSMETIMSLVLEESEEIPPELFSLLLDSVKKSNEEVLPSAQKLAEKVLRNCSASAKIRIWLVQAVKSLGISVDDLSEVVASICQESPDASDQNGTHDVNDRPVSLEKGIEVAPSEQVDPAVEKAPKPVVSNGITQAGAKGTSRDVSFSKNQDQGFSDPSRSINASSNAESEGVAMVEHESRSEETTRTSGREPTSVETLDVSHIDNEKDTEKELDNETQDKDVSDELGNVDSQEKEVPEVVGDDKAENEEILSGSDGDKTLGKEVSSDPNGNETLGKKVSSEPNGSEILGKEVSIETDVVNILNREVSTGDKTLAKEVSRESDGDKTLAQDVAVSPENVEGKEDLGSLVNKEAEEVPNLSIEKTKEEEVAVIPENVQAKEDPSSLVSKKAEEEVPNMTIEKTKENNDQVEEKYVSKSTIEKTKEKGVPEQLDIKQVEEKDAPSSSDSERTLDDDISAKKNLPTEIEIESTLQSSSPKELEDQNADDGMLSPIKNLNMKNSKKARSNRKQSLKVIGDPENDESKKISETSDTGSRPKRQASKKAPVGVSGESKSPPTQDGSKERRKGSAELTQKQLGMKGASTKSSAKEDGKKRVRGKVVEDDHKKSASEDEKSSSVKDVHKEMRSSSNSSKKSSKDERQLKKTPAVSSQGKRKASDIEEYGENLVGSRIKVLWPEDEVYYPGEIESFDPVKNEHKVNYDDGDVEVLKLKQEKWEFINTDSELDEAKTAILSSPDASSERPQKKKVKSSRGPSANRVKSGSSSGKGGASSSKSKSAATKSGAKSGDASKSVDRSGGRSKDRVSGKKAVTPASKTDRKLKDDSLDTPKTSNSKSKNAEYVTPKTSKPKQDTPKTAAKPKQDPPSKSKGKRPRSSGKSDSDDDLKLKSLSLKAKKSKEVTGKSPQSSNAKKRQKVTKS